MAVEPGYIYVIEFKFKKSIVGVKIGLTRDPKKRLMSYQHPWCVPISNYQVYSCDDPELAELRLKRTYKSGIESNSWEFITGFTFAGIRQTALKIVNEINK